MLEQAIGSEVIAKGVFSKVVRNLTALLSLRTLIHTLLPE